MGNQQERQLFDIGWLVGILDGEGCFSLCKFKTGRKKQSDYIFPQIIIASTSPEITTKAQEILARLEISSHIVYYPSKKATQKAYWSIRVTGIKRIKRFMDVLFNYLECRKAQAKVLKDFVELRIAKPLRAPYDVEDEMVDAIKLLNQRGTTESSETTRQTPSQVMI